MNAIRLNSAHLGSSSSKYLFGFRDKSFSNLLVEYRFGRKPRRSRTEVDGLNKAWVICSLQACSVSRTSEDFKFWVIRSLYCEIFQCENLDLMAFTQQQQQQKAVETAEQLHLKSGVTQERCMSEGGLLDHND
ncbi:uncharacterized protein WM277_007431 isoform 2-T10 [Molossus nigricans]